MTYVTADGGHVLGLGAAPMNASGFTSLAKHFRDRTVVTYDPRGVARSVRADGARWGTPDEHGDDLLLGGHIVACTHYEYDFDALRAAPTRIVVPSGAESAGEMAHRGALGVEVVLGQEAVIFPSQHGGFLGGDFGWKG